MWQQTGFLFTEVGTLSDPLMISILHTNFVT